MTTQATTQGIGTVGKARSAVLFTLALAATLAAMVALAGLAQRAEAASPETIVFVSARTTGKGVNNPTGDAEIFKMNPNGTGLRQLTFNEVFDSRPLLSPDGQKILYHSQGAQASNLEGDQELYVMNASDGSGKRNLSDNGGGVDEFYGVYSPDGQKLLYQSDGAQASNPEGESEVYVMNAADGSAKKNLTNNTVRDFYPEWGR